MEILQLKNVVTEIKSSVDGHDSRFVRTQKSYEPKHRQIEITKFE